MELIITNKKGEKFTVLYDDEDHGLVSKYKWHVSGGYVVAWSKQIRGERRQVAMHRVILGITDSSIFVDHKNHITTDNRRINIRACTQTENRRNTLPKKSKLCRFVGVCCIKRFGKSGQVWTYFVATIRMHGKSKHIGYFKSEDAAARAYDAAAKQLFGEFANPNFK